MVKEKSPNTIYRSIGYLVLTGLLSVGGGTVGNRITSPSKANDNLEKQIADLHEEVHGLQKQVSALRLQTIDRDSQYVQLQADIEALQIEIRKLKKGVKQ